MASNVPLLTFLSIHASAVDFPENTTSTLHEWQEEWDREQMESTPSKLWWRAMRGDSGSVGRNREGRRGPVLPHPRRSIVLSWPSPLT